ncbi:MAG: DUF302 domain-containing protein [Phycisphaerales bacterium]|nr:DUF302 domain-containing protein [Phycisphaerales bacterium]
MTEIAVTRQVSMPYDQTVDRMKAALREEGFGVLTEIDVRATLREKLAVDFRNYVILGACNPALAHRALQADLSIGALLPCNVVVYDDGDGSVVSIFDPEVGMGIAGSPALEPIAIEAKARLLRAMDRL